MYIEMNAKEMSNIMNMQPQLDMDLENKYLLLTRTIINIGNSTPCHAKDWCTWDQEYNSLVQDIRSRLVNLATSQPENIRLC